ncbi:MAG: ATP synthase subunit I [Blastocatellia bacterium]
MLTSDDVPSPLPSQEEAALERRLHRNRLIVLGLALLVSLPFGTTKMTIGIGVGGILGHFNQRWLSSSIKGILAAAASGDSPVPSGTVLRLFLRYALVGAGIGVALWWRVADPIGLAIGLSAYVGGVLIEAGAIFYRAVRQAPPEDEAALAPLEMDDRQGETEKREDLPRTDTDRNP